MTPDQLAALRKAAEAFHRHRELLPATGDELIAYYSARDSYRAMVALPAAILSLLDALEREHRRVSDLTDFIHERGLEVPE